jgi:hypothetical protein
MSGEKQARSARPGRIGPWRLLDIFMATVPLRGAMFGGVAVLPEYGAPDALASTRDPFEELPGSNIGEGERRQAVQREQARRFVRARQAAR